jgi:transposase
MKNAEFLLKEGKSERQVAAIVGISKSMVHKINAGLEKLGPKLTGGRVSKLSSRDKTFCVRSVVKDGKTNATDVKKSLQESLDVVVSTATVRRALKEAGLVSFVRPSKPDISRKNVKARLAFARSHLEWTMDDWKRVIWSDETRMSLFGSDGRYYTWKRSEERLQPKHVRRTVKHGGRGLMIWGCITYDGPGYMTKIDDILDKQLYELILKEELQHSIDWYDYDASKVIFQHDNDPKHTAKTVKKYLEEQEYTTMVWPPQSPDLNPIENIWSMVKLRLFRNYDSPPKGIHDLWDRVQEVWDTLTVEDCRKVIDSMPKRCSDVIKAKGYWIDY